MDKSVKVDLQKLTACLEKLERSGKPDIGAEFNEGFKHALSYVRRFVLPAIEEEEILDKNNFLYQFQQELDSLALIIEELEADIRRLDGPNSIDPEI